MEEYGKVVERITILGLGEKGSAVTDFGSTQIGGGHFKQSQVVPCLGIHRMNRSCLLVGATGLVGAALERSGDTQIEPRFGMARRLRHEEFVVLCCLVVVPLEVEEVGEGPTQIFAGWLADQCLSNTG